MTPTHPHIAAILRADDAALLNLTNRQQRFVEIVRSSGVHTVRALADSVKRDESSIRERLERIARVLAIDPELAARLRVSGANDLADARAAWLKNKNGDSTYVALPKPAADTGAVLEDALADTLEAMRAHAPVYIPPPAPSAVSHLLVIDPADVHIGKVCSFGETGERYDIPAAVERVRSGINQLLAKAEGHDISRAVFVLGNDILHTEDGHRTTNGTDQDTDGTWHDAFNAARAIYVEVIEQIAQRYPVHLVFCPSNHDRRSGYALAQLVGAWFHNHPNVISSDYYLGPRPRKYLVYGEALLGFTHMDGIKDAALPGLMQHEARGLWGQTRFAYWYTHHWHHKNRTRHGLNPGVLEKDMTGVTIVNGRTQEPGDSVEIEVLRSPSPPDGWHALSGHVNLQAIECFLHGPDGAQTGRFTAWL
jgi:hypothetical protein